MKPLYCDVCERHFSAKLSTPDDVAFLKHGNKSKYHVNHKKEQADDLSIRSSESEEFVLTNASSFIQMWDPWITSTFLVVLYALVI